MARVRVRAATAISLLCSQQLVLLSHTSRGREVCSGNGLQLPSVCCCWTCEIIWPYDVTACSSHGCYVEGYELGNIFTLNIKMRLGASVWITTRVLQHIMTLEERSVHWGWGTWAWDRENLQALHPYPLSGQKASVRLGMLHGDCLYSWICRWEAEVVRPFIDWKSWKWSISALFLGGDSCSHFSGSHNRIKYTAQRNK